MKQLFYFLSRTELAISRQHVPPAMKALHAAATTVAMTGAALAENIGVSMARFDDDFLTEQRDAEPREGIDRVNPRIEDARNDVSKQLSQVQDELVMPANMEQYLSKN